MAPVAPVGSGIVRFVAGGAAGVVGAEGGRGGGPYRDVPLVRPGDGLFGRPARLGGLVGARHDRFVGDARTAAPGARGRRGSTSVRRALGRVMWRGPGHGRG